ncbi:MAG: ATP-binding protein [Lachnospiraceae bacterium]|nr:ATP-binding protein [Lachnospiraceae bacterium]
MQEYEERRARSERLQRKRREEIYQAIPLYRELDHKIADISTEAATKLILGDSQAPVEAESEISEITRKKNELLAQNGFPLDYLEPVYVCPDCKDTGFIRHEKCHCLKQRIIDGMYRRSDFYPKLKEENFDTFSFDYFSGDVLAEMKQIYKIARSFVDRFANDYTNMLFYGSVGNGKTFLSNCIAKALMDQGYSVIYVTALRLFDILNSHVFRSRDPDYDAESYNNLFQCSLLIIDDLGTEGVYSATMVTSSFLEILDERDMAHRSTLISSNLSFDALKEAYEERSFSRLLGNYEVIRFNGPDIRLMKRRQV